jgi:hypothetical protein
MNSEQRIGYRQRDERPGIRNDQRDIHPNTCS